MNTVLLLNHTTHGCGIYQDGLREIDILSESKLVNYIYKEVESMSDFRKAEEETNPDYILFNWCQTTMPWLPADLEISTKAKQYYILHDIPVRKHYYKQVLIGEGRNYNNGYIDENNSFDISRSITVPRPLFKYTNLYEKNSIPTIGSFGLMSSWHKGFDKIVSRVNEEFDEAVINIHITIADFCGNSNQDREKMIELCKKLNIKDGIKLNITTNHLDNYDLLDLLAKNDINMLYYRFAPGQTGLSGATDYLLSVNRPVGINHTEPFRHIYKEEIDYEKRSIREIIDGGTAPLEEFYKRWSTDNFRDILDKEFSK